MLTSQEKWDRMKAICEHWCGILGKGDTDLDFKRLRSDQGFMVYVTQTYPGMKPYLKGFHLSLETWRGGRDSKGWKLPKQQESVTKEEGTDATTSSLDNLKVDLITRSLTGRDGPNDGPASGVTQAAPPFQQDLDAILHLAEGDTPRMRCVQSKRTLTAYYGFGDASLAGFGSTVARPDGLYGRFGIWGKDAEDQSSNYRELRNLVKTVEEEALDGYLTGGEFWLFTDNTTAEGCFFRVGSSSKLIHELVVNRKF